MDAQQITIDSHSMADTEAFGERLGRQLRGGEVIELSSDLGGGKTTLVRGIVRGAGSDDHVASPTFTVSKVYTTAGGNKDDDVRDPKPQLRIHHFDFYRLPAAGNMAEELAELIEDRSNVIIIEWSDVVQQVLPANHIKITLERVKTSEDDRRLILEVPETMSYMTKEVAR